MYVATGIQLALERSQVVEPRVTKSMKPLLTMARQDFIKRVQQHPAVDIAVLCCAHIPRHGTMIAKQITVTSLDTGHFCLVASFVLLLSLTSFVSESWKVINTQTPIFDEFGVEYIRNQVPQLARFSPAHTPTTTTATTATITQLIQQVSPSLSHPAFSPCNCYAAMARSSALATNPLLACTRPTRCSSSLWMACASTMVRDALLAPPSRAHI